MRRSKTCILPVAVLSLCCWLARPAVGESTAIVFPEDAGVLDVRAFGAKGDGRADDTAAIQRALDQKPNGNRIIYLPPGTYLVSDTLRWPAGRHEGETMKRTMLQGAGADRSVIRLADNASGFDTAIPKPVLYAGAKPAQRFRNAVRDLTIDTGRGNPGAAGAQFIANNQGTFRDVVIRSGDGGGLIGLDLGYTGEQGPCLVKNVTVEGFDLGVSTRHVVDSVTIEHLTLRGQNVVGLRNVEQVVSIRGLRSENAVPAVYNSHPNGLVTLIDAELVGTGGAAGKAAVVNDENATLFARNVRTRGYARAIDNRAGLGSGVESADVTEFVSHRPLAAGSGQPRSLNLPIRETPDVPWDDPSQWVSPDQFGAKRDDKADDTEAFQRAIDSGKTTVYLRAGGKYIINGTLDVRGGVRRIIGCEGSIGGDGVIRIADGTASVVRFERIEMGYSKLSIRHEAKRTVVLSSVLGGSYTAGNGAGDVFLEDVCATPWRFTKGQNVWARQLDPESRGVSKIVNDGANVWILGIKTEYEGSVAETVNGGRTEILGGFVYGNAKPKTTPMFVVGDGASLSVTLGEASFNGTAFASIVEATIDGRTHRVSKGQTGTRANGSMVPLLVVRPGATDDHGTPTYGPQPSARRRTAHSTSLPEEE